MQPKAGEARVSKDDLRNSKTIGPSSSGVHLSVEKARGEQELVGSLTSELRGDAIISKVSSRAKFPRSMKLELEL